MTINSAGSSSSASWRDSIFECRIPRYTDTTYYKRSMNLSWQAHGSSYGSIEGTATLQSNNTNAISAIQLQLNGGYSIIGESQWWLYGIKNS